MNFVVGLREKNPPQELSGTNSWYLMIGGRHLVLRHRATESPTLWRESHCQECRPENEALATKHITGWPTGGNAGNTVTSIFLSLKLCGHRLYFNEPCRLWPPTCHAGLLHKVSFSTCDFCLVNPLRISPRWQWNCRHLAPTRNISTAFGATWNLQAAIVRKWIIWLRRTAMLLLRFMKPRGFIICSCVHMRSPKYGIPFISSYCEPGVGNQCVSTLGHGRASAVGFMIGSLYACVKIIIHSGEAMLTIRKITVPLLSQLWPKGSLDSCWWISSSTCGISTWLPHIFLTIWWWVNIGVPPAKTENCGPWDLQLGPTPSSKWNDTGHAVFRLCASCWFQPLKTKNWVLISNLLCLD